MAAASSVCHLGLLHCGRYSFGYNSSSAEGVVFGPQAHTVIHSCVSTLRPWNSPDMFSPGVIFSVRLGLWSESQRRWHINRLELEAVS